MSCGLRSFSSLNRGNLSYFPHSNIIQDGFIELKIEDFYILYKYILYILYILYNFRCGLGTMPSLLNSAIS